MKPSPLDDESPLIHSATVNGSPHKYGTTPHPDDDRHDDFDFVPLHHQKQSLRLWEIAAILSTAFSYGCIISTLFLITLPVECRRIQHDHPTIQKSISLAVFVAIAGVTQLVTPLAGMLSDTYKPPIDNIGQRLPYLVLGTTCTVIGLLGQGFSSAWSFWIRYSFFFFLHMIGLNIIYSQMIALIPDQVPEYQTGVANGTLALLLVTGSLFGFGLFHTFLSEDILSMYGLYTCIVIFASILTCSYAHEMDVKLAHHRRGLDENAPKFVPPRKLLRSMLVDPIQRMDWKTLRKSYTIDATNYHDFFIATVSRTFYYMGISIQAFFLYFLHDVIHVTDDPESKVALLAILGQSVGALTCYPVGLASDKLFGSRRKPFIYLACAILASASLSLIFMRTFHQMVIVSFILGGANGMYLTMETSLAVDTLPDDQYELSEDESGIAQLLGVWGVAGFVGSALGPLLGGPMLLAFGDPSEDEDGDVVYSLTGYAVCISMASLYFTISAFVLQFIREENLSVHSGHLSHGT
jgi:sugar phosphate permease